MSHLIQLVKTTFFPWLLTEKARTCQIKMLHNLVTYGLVLRTPKRLDKYYLYKIDVISKC